MFDYLKRKLGANVRVVYHQRSEGHGIQHDDIPLDTDLLIVLDSSSNEVDECKRLSKDMDIIIIDHHSVDIDNPYAILVNPQQEGCEYPNKSISASLLALKFVEVLDYHYKKIDIHIYSDLAGLSLLSDVMDMRELENRFFVSQTLKHQFNPALAAMLQVQRLNPAKLTATDLDFKVIPLINTLTRMDEIDKALVMMTTTDYSLVKKMVRYAVRKNEERKEIQQNLLLKYKPLIQDGKFAVVISKEASKNFNGVVAGKIAEEKKKPCLILKDMGDRYAGSFRSYAGFNMLEFLQECPYVDMAAGHSGAGGVQISVDNYNKFLQYVDEKLKDVEFVPEIIYDFEITEKELTMDFVEEILKFDRIYGENFPKIKLRINDVTINDREVFPSRNPEHVKLVAEGFDMLKFFDKNYAKEVGTWDSVDVIGTLDINEWNNQKTIQIMIEDYKKK